MKMTDEQIRASQLAWGRARQILEPGDRLYIERCAGIRCTVTFDGFCCPPAHHWIRSKTLDDISARHILRLNGQPRTFREPEADPAVEAAAVRAADQYAEWSAERALQRAADALSSPAQAGAPGRNAGGHAGMSADILTQGRELMEKHLEGAAGYTGKKNAYECDGEGGGLGTGKPGCGAFIVTIDRDPGVTPFMLKCGRCGAFAHSKMYRVAERLEPTHEWYRPETLEGIDPAYFDHLSHGGIILRPIAGKPDEWLPPMTESDPASKAKLAILEADLFAAKFRAARAAADGAYLVKELSKEPMSRQQRRHIARQKKH